MAGSIKLPRGLKHSFWGVLDASLYPAIYLATMPALVSGLGAVAFGLWMLVNSIVVTLQLFNLNIGVTTIRYVSQSMASAKDEDTNVLINAIFQVITFLLFVVLVVGVLMAWLIPQFHALQLSDAPVQNISLLLFLSAAFAGLKFFDLVCNSLLKAAEHFRAAAILNTTNRSALLLINVTMARAGASVQDLLLANLVFAVVFILLQLYVLSRKFPFFSLLFHRQVHWYQPLIRFSFFPWLQFLLVILAFQTDRLWVAHYAGLKELSSYSLVATIFNHVHMIFIAIAGWMLPRLSAMTARGEDPMPLYQNVRAMLLLLSTGALLCFFALYPYLLPMWIGAGVFSGIAPYVRAFIGFELVFIHTIMPFFYLNATGKERLATATTALYAVPAYLLMVGAIYWYHSPLVMVRAMTGGIAVAAPILNFIVDRRSGKRTQLLMAYFELLPFYLAITMLYVPGIWPKVLLLVIIAGLLLQNYLPDIRKTKTWRQQIT